MQKAAGVAIIPGFILEGGHWNDRKKKHQLLDPKKAKEQWISLTKLRAICYDIYIRTHIYIHIIYIIYDTLYLIYNI